MNAIAMRGRKKRKKEREQKKKEQTDQEKTIKDNHKMKITKNE